MGLIARSVLFILATIIEQHLLVTANDDPVLQHNKGHCWLNNASIGENFQTIVGCNRLHLAFINFTETSQELFDKLADGVDTMGVFRSNVDYVYLHNNLIDFQLIGNDGGTTQVVVEANATYRLQTLVLNNIAQLPANIGKLHLLKTFTCNKVYAANVDFTIFRNMMQLEQLTINDISSVTIPDSLMLPSLQKLTISNGLLAFFNDTSCPAPKLEVLILENNNLVVLPKAFTACSNLTLLSVTRNMLRTFSLDIFTNLAQLEFLAMMDNQILSITTQTTLELPHLRQLHLSDNELTDLNVTLWIFPALQYLSLGNNRLTRVAGLAALFAGKIRTFAASNNPWDCEWLNGTVQQIPDLQMYGSKNDFCPILQKRYLG